MGELRTAADALNSVQQQLSERVDQLNAQQQDIADLQMQNQGLRER